MSQAADNVSPTTVMHLRRRRRYENANASFSNVAEYDSAAHRQPHALRFIVPRAAFVR